MITGRSKPSPTVALQYDHSPRTCSFHFPKNQNKFIAPNPVAQTNSPEATPLRVDRTALMDVRIERVRLMCSYPGERFGYQVELFIHYNHRLFGSYRGGSATRVESLVECRRLCPSGHLLRFSAPLSKDCEMTATAQPATRAAMLSKRWATVSFI